MRTRFDRLLAQPSTLHFLRQLIAPPPEHAATQLSSQALFGRLAVRSAATATAADSEEHEAALIRRVDEKHSVAELLGASTQEYGLRMSMSSGVPLFQPGLARESSFQAIRYQADVNSKAKHGKLLVDHEEHRENYRLWIDLLHFRRRLDGLRGVLDIWHGVMRRDVELPTEGEEADLLWEEFIHAASARRDAHKNVQSEDLRHELFDYAVELKERTGRQYHKLYKGLVGHSFRADVAGASHWHRKMLSAGLVSPENALKQIASDALRNPYPDAGFKTFSKFYNQSTERDCYDSVVPEAVRLRGSEYALKWHRMFLKNGDGPSANTFNMPAVQALFELDKDVSLPMKHQVQSKESTSTAPRQHDTRVYAPITRASMSALIGDVHGIKPREMSDSVVAKMFATRAFSLDLVIRGLSFFAIDTVGPLAVREMAVRAGSAIELCNKLNDLRRADIKVADSAYSRLIRKLASEGQTELFDALLASDQHPEGYDDTRTQEALLISHLESGNWALAHITMTSLTLAGVALESRAVNRLVQHYLRIRAWRLVAHTIQSMQSQKLPLTVTTITYLHRYLLPERRRGKRPVESQRVDRPRFDALDFVTNACMYSDKLVRNVHSKLWVELLKRYGMAFRWVELEKLVIWLTARYAPRPSRFWRGKGGGKVIKMRRSSRLEEIFTEQMQQAIFTWGFRAAAVRGQLRPPALVKLGDDFTDTSRSTAVSDYGQDGRWSQGLRLLKRLRRYRFTVHDWIVRRAFYTRMWILFGPGHSTKGLNELARQTNQLRLADYLRQGNAAYNGLLMPDLNPKLLTDDTPNEAVLKLAFFGRVGELITRREK